MDIKIFERIEKKYIISEQQKSEIMQEISERMEKDGYFESEVFNIYFDTDNYDLIIKSIENPDFKEKFRARSYGGYDKVFLEIKTKQREGKERVGYKRRVLITHEDFKKLTSGKATAEELARQKIEKADDVQIAKEVDHLVQLLDLKPRILVYYDRESYLGEGGLRITFDSDLRYRAEDLKFVRKKKDQKYFKDERNIIMEIKAHGAIPLWLAHELSRIRAFPEKFSKIGKIYELTRKETNV